MTVEKADWMSEEGYRSALERGAFRRAPAFDDLTRGQLAARGLLGLATFIVALAAVAAAIGCLGLAANKLAGINSAPWTVEWMADTFKSGILALIAVAVMALIVYGAFLRLAWPALIELGIWVLSKSKKNR